MLVPAYLDSTSFCFPINDCVCKNHLSVGCLDGPLLGWSWILLVEQRSKNRGGKWTVPTRIRFRSQKGKQQFLKDLLVEPKTIKYKNSPKRPLSIAQNNQRLQKPKVPRNRSSEQKTLSQATCMSKAQYLRQSMIHSVQFGLLAFLGSSSFSSRRVFVAAPPVEALVWLVCLVGLFGRF